MSSTWQGYPASGCIDGANGHLGCHTAAPHEADPWLRIDLGATANVAWVQIYNDVRTCSSRLGYFELWTSADGSSYTQCAAGGSGGSDACDSATEPGPGPFMMACTASAQYVELRLPGNTRTVSLNEVYVLATSAPPPLPTLPPPLPTAPPASSLYFLPRAGAR